MSLKMQFTPVRRPPTAAQIDRNLRFGVATGLTKTAKEAQAASIGSIKGNFTTRGQWFKPSNKFGIRIKTAKRDDLEAVVHTAADWLELHEKGGTKRARGGRLAIPTENVRRNKRDIITRANRPKALRGKKTFVIKTKSGPVLFQRRRTGLRYQGPLASGRVMRRMKRTGTELVALYNLEQRARIRKQSTFFEPIDKVVHRRLDRNVIAGMERAIRTMK